MGLNEITDRLERAKKNRDALEQQRLNATKELERISMLKIKWTGICEYLESLLPAKPKPNTLSTYKIGGFVPNKQN